MDETAARILREQWYCVIATASADGEPWATPVFYNYDHTYRFVWESSRHTRHSQLIAANPRIALVVANLARREADEALYFSCLAREVPPERLDEALHVYLNGGHPRQPSIPRTTALYRGDQPLRLYEATPMHAYRLVVSYDASGRRLDRREPLSLTDED